MSPTLFGARFYSLLRHLIPGLSPAGRNRGRWPRRGLPDDIGKVAADMRKLNSHGPRTAPAGHMIRGPTGMVVALLLIPLGWTLYKASRPSRRVAGLGRGYHTGIPAAIMFRSCGRRNSRGVPGTAAAVWSCRGAARAAQKGAASPEGSPHEGQSVREDGCGLGVPGRPGGCRPRNKACTVTVTQLKSPGRAGVVRAMAGADHWHCVSVPQTLWVPGTSLSVDGDGVASPRNSSPGGAVPTAVPVRSASRARTSL